MIKYEDIKAVYVNHMGTDLDVVNAARVSFDKASSHLSKSDEWLIKYLSDHDHFSPFTHVMITLRETVPIPIARQRFKHTIGFTYNEVSRRYVDSAPSYYKPDKWRGRADHVKQGSSETTVDINPPNYFGRRTMVDAYESSLQQANYAYELLLKRGVCPEQARFVLPQAAMVEYIATGSLYAFARAYRLRSSPDAQKESRDLAKFWNDIIRALYPVSWKQLVGGDDNE